MAAQPLLWALSTALETRAVPIPCRCLGGMTDTGASANAGNGASILDSRT